MKIALRESVVDNSKCVGCRRCESHCPSQAIRVKSVTDENKYLSPCQRACPAGVNIPGYIALAGEGKFEDAYRLIRRDNPFPSVCGRICTHPCQDQCNRDSYDAPVAIKDVKRFVADTVSGKIKQETVWAKNGKSVGIIGAGPSGLSCAYYLALSGYDVDVYESSPVAGGVLVFGIPEYRLPKKILAQEIKQIEEVGVNIHLSTEVGKDITFDELKKKHDAMYLATGTQFSRKADIAGEDKNGVYHGLDFLKNVNLGKPPAIGKKTVVIGGGNTAIDSARTAVRLGCQDVTILYRRRQVEMPAEPREVLEAVEEGVKIITLATPIEFVGEKKVERIHCSRMALGERGEDGRKTPHKVDGQDFDLEADTVIVAVSQYSDFPFIRKDEVEVTQWGSLVVEDNMMIATMPGVFSGGDVVRGSETAITAIADGKQAAANINKYLGVGSGINYGADISIPSKEDYEWVHDTISKMPCLKPADRVKSNMEVALGLTAEQAAIESKRCFRCSGQAAVETEYCVDCQMCWEYCQHDAITMKPLEKPRFFKHPDPEPKDCEKTLDILKNARMYPDSILCFCTFTTALEIVGSILAGATTPEAIVRKTGMKGGCNMYCTVPVTRVLRAAGYPQENREDGMWQNLGMDIHDFPSHECDPIVNVDKYKKIAWNEETFGAKADVYRNTCKEALAR